MLFIKSDSFDPYYNLALEEYLFDELGKKEPCFMLWQNSNTIVVGKNQNTIEEVNMEYANSHGIRVARRLSGGGAVYHDMGNLNYTIVAAQETAEDFNFEIFVKPVIGALSVLGIEAEFNGRNDVIIGGRKVSGSAQYRKRGRILHHGCIMLDSNLHSLEEALKVRKIKIQSKGARSVASRVTTVNANAPVKITMQQFEDALLQEISKKSHLTRYVLNEEDRKSVMERYEKKYSTWEWNWGFFGDYEMSREKKFSAGIVTVYMNVRDACIEDIRLFGDFFGDGDVQELEESMRGIRLDGHLTEELEKRNISYYMNGISAEELYELLLY